MSGPSTSNDPMEQLRTAQPMRRGERLATWIESGAHPPTHKTWCKLRYLSYSLSFGFEGSKPRTEAAKHMRLHAAMPNRPRTAFMTRRSVHRAISGPMSDTLTQRR